MEGEKDKLVEATAQTSSGPSPTKARGASLALNGHDDYAPVPTESADNLHTRAKSVDLRMTASLRDSDLTDDVGESDKPMRRSVSWPDWSENRELVKVHRVHKYIVPEPRRSRAFLDMHRETLLRMFVLGIVFLVVVMVIMALFIIRIIIG